MAVWDDVLPEEDRRVFELAGWGRDAGFGERPVLLVVDVIYNFVGDRPEPILESVKRWRYSCGERGWEGIRHLQDLIAAAREREVPIFYTGMDRRPDGFDQGSWNWKSHRSGDDVDVMGHLGNEIVAEIAPAAAGRLLRQAQAERVPRHPAARPPRLPGRRHGDRHRHHDLGLRARHARSTPPSTTSAPSCRRSASGTAGR